MQMVRALIEIGFEVDLVSFPAGAKLEMPHYQQFSCHALPGSRHIPIGFSTSKVLMNIALAWCVRGLLRTRAYDVVHAVEEAAFYAAPMAARRNIPVVVDLDSDIVDQLEANNSPLVRSLSRPAHWLRKRSLQRAVAAITIAPALTELVHALSPQTPVIEARDFAIPEMARQPSPDAIRKLRAELDLDDAPVIAYTGNLDRRQGLEVLLEAFKISLIDHPDAILLIVGGETFEIEALASQAQMLGITANTRLIAKQPVELVADYMALADVLVSPRLEPLVTPMKIYAYMASGRPIVASDLPTHRAVLSDDMAFLVEPSVEGLARGLIDVLDHPELAKERATKAKAHVVEHHNFDRFREQVRGAYGRIQSPDLESRLSIAVQR